MKKLLSVLLILSALSGSAQIKVSQLQKRTTRADSALVLISYQNTSLAMYLIDVCKSVGASSIDTASLSGRINAKVDKITGMGLSSNDYTSTEKTKLAGVATGATANSSDAILLSRANHTGTESADAITDGTTNKAYTAAEKTKLAGIAAGATVNSSDATLLNRSNHTGSQSQSTITGLSDSLKVRQRNGLTPTRGLLIGDSETDTAFGQSRLDSFILAGIDTTLGFTIKNQARFGNTIYQQDSTWLTDPNKGTYDWIIVMIGLNDVWNYATENAAAALSRYQTLINDINTYKKAGTPVLVAAMQPVDYAALYGSTQGALAYAKWLAMNQAMMGRGSSLITGVDYRFDDHMWILNNGAGALTAIYDNGDHIHTNNLGRTQVAHIYRNMLNRAGFFSNRTLKYPNEFWNYSGGNTNILTPKTPQLSIGTASTGSFALGATSALAKFYLVNNSSVAGHIDFWSTGTSTASSGITSAFAFTPTFNESGTAGNNVVYISPYYQSNGSGVHYLLRAGTNTSSNGSGTHTDKFTVDNAGNVSIAGNLTIAGTYPGSGAGVWGSITGTLSSQTDLQSALNLRATYASPTFTGVVYTPQIGIGMTSGASAKLHVTNTSSSANNIGFWVTGQSTASSGINSAFALTPNWNETGTAGHNAIFISPYVQASGSGANYIMRIGTNTAANASGTHTDKWTLAENGNVVSTGTTNGATPTEMGYLSGVNASLQSQLNAKQPTVSLTTTGTSGAATFNSSTGALNIPQYSGGSGSFDTTYTKARIDSIATRYYRQIAVNNTQVAYTASATTETGAQVTLTIPANSISANGTLYINSLFSSTNSANSKTVRWKINGTTVWSVAITTAASYKTACQISNRNATNAQITGPQASSSASITFGGGAGTVQTFTFDTTSSLTLTVTFQCATTGESLNLESIQVFAAG